MDLQLTYELSLSLLMEGSRRIRRIRYRITAVYAATLLLVGLWLLWGGSPWTGLGWVMVVSGPVTLLILDLQLRRIARKQLAMVMGPIETELREDTIRQRMATMNSEIKWQAVTAVCESPRLWLLHLNPYQAIHLPKAAFGPEAEASFKAFLKARGFLVA